MSSEQRRSGEQANGGGGAAKDTLTVVVNGEPIEIRANENQALEAVIQHALAQAQQTGRPAEDWELRAGADAGAPLLDPSKKLRDYGLTLAATLFLSLKSGGGGGR